MKIMFSTSSHPGDAELTQISDSDRVPCGKVRLRQARLKEMVHQLYAQLPAYKRANDRETCEIIEDKIQLCEQKIAMLKTIRSPNQHAQYQAYIDFCAQN